jgi:signal peptidase II
MRSLLPWLTAAVIVLLDRVSKLAIMRHLEPMDPSSWIEVFPGLTITHVRNRGIAFSLFSDGGPLSRVLLHALIGVAVVVIAWMLVNHSKRGRLPAIAFGLILGGAVGNLLDRVMYGWVVDFVHVWLRLGTTTHAWPDFNVADSAITVGAVTLIAYEILVGRKEDDAPDPG